MLGILEERDFPVDELTLLASERTAGTRLRFRDREHTVGVLSLEALEGADLALASRCGAPSLRRVPQAAEAGTICVDNSSAFRMEPWAELVIPEVNPEALERGAKVYAVPNCTIITALMALAPLHRAAGLRAVSLSSYQSVSGAGAKGVRELTEQVEKLHGMEDDLANPIRGAAGGRGVRQDDRVQRGRQDRRVRRGDRVHVRGDQGPARGRRILSMPSLDIWATCVRVPVPVGHSVSLHATFQQPCP